jgi:hypothetical protein
MGRHSTKASEKRDSLQREISEQKKKRNRRIALAVILIALVSVSGFITYSVLNQSSTTQPFSFRAAIIDQLALDNPNQTFVQSATSLLQGAGFTVDYYPSDQVTVDLYSHLPSLDYGVIILRAHTALSLGGTTLGGLFTSEPYSTSKYVYEQLTDQLGEGYSIGPTYFTVLPAFVQSSMNGHFPKSVIIVMGCDGLQNSNLATAFTKKGAQAYISWTNRVSPSYTDSTTLKLLQNLLTQRLPIDEAVAQTMSEVGPDPTYHSSLIAYPPDLNAPAF